MATPTPEHEQLDFFDICTGELVRTMAVELSPGVHQILQPDLVSPDVLPRWGTCEYVKRPDGSFIAIARTHGSLLKLTTGIGQQLGVKGAAGKSIYETIKRCCWAGFIKHKRWPDAYYIDMHSLFKFLKRIENPGFWTPERIDRLRDARDGPMPDPDNEYFKPEKL